MASINGRITKVDFTKKTIEGVVEKIRDNKSIVLCLEFNGSKIDEYPVKEDGYFIFTNINFNEVFSLNLFAKGDTLLNIKNISNNIFLLARQRTGTNVLRKFLNSHKDIFSINEIFDPGVFNNKTFDDFSDFNKMIYNQETDLIGSFFPYHFNLVNRLKKPISYKQTLTKYLNDISFFSQAKCNVIDIKYNHFHNITEYIEPILNKKTNIFKIIKQNNLKVINLTRKNYLRSYISGQLASKSGNYVLAKDSKKNEHEDIKIDININQLLYSMKIMSEEDKFIADNLKDYDGYINIEYNEMFDEYGAFDSNFSENIAHFLDIDNKFNREPMLKKLQNRTLANIINNFKEVEERLKETSFAYCLNE